jgi:hypothetical protein
VGAAARVVQGGGVEAVALRAKRKTACIQERSSMLVVHD